MRYSQANPGRVFVIRLEDGDVVHECIEAFAREHGIQAAGLIALGGGDDGSCLVVGPEEGRSSPAVPMTRLLEGVHEVAGVGTIFPNAEGQPILHMHVGAGRDGKTACGCIRMGLKVWHVLEVILWELKGSTGHRLFDDSTGFELLEP